MAKLSRHYFRPNFLRSPPLSSPKPSKALRLFFPLHNKTLKTRPFSPSSLPLKPKMGSLSILEDLHLKYPPVRRDDSVVDDYHGVRIPDPYRWLEDPDADEVKDFVEKQATLTEVLIQSCETREKLKNQILTLFDHPRYDTPSKQADKYFYSHNTGLQAQSILYMLDDLEGKPEVLLDPNSLSKDGTVALSISSVSEDAKFLAYGLSSSGSDWVAIKVMRIEDKIAEPDSLSWVKFSSISWTHDNKGFFYSRYPAPKEGEQLDAGTETNININHEVYYHFLGTDQSQDILCWKDPEHPKWSFSAEVTEDGKYLLLSIGEGCDPVNKLYYCDLSALPGGLEGLRERDDMLPFVKLVDNFDALYEAVSNDGCQFTFRTNKDAPRYKLVRVDLKEPSVWTDVLQEAEKDVLESAQAVNGNQLLVSYLSDCKYVLQIRDLETGLLQHPIPLDIGTVYGISGKRKDHEVFISFTSFLTPGIIYRCNLATEVPEMKIFREIVVSGFDRTEFQVNQIYSSPNEPNKTFVEECYLQNASASMLHALLWHIVRDVVLSSDGALSECALDKKKGWFSYQVFAPSKDGTKIPMFIMCKKNIVLDGSHPSLLYGYGGFNISITPSFSVSRIVLTRHLGVVFCTANIRGGGEYGEEWHKAGSLSKKQNCFDDFIAAAEYLVSAGYTQPQKLCIEGGSNGGLLVAACVNQRPDLFGCALAHVGVMDMLRFHKFTIGHAWTSDYGSSDKEEEFQWLIKYSPLHNVKRPWEHLGGQTCQYPPIMLLTADHDDRVVPLHSLKLLATMQYVLCTSLENSPQTKPIVARIDRNAGHGAGRPTQKLIDEAADRYSFMAKMLGISWMN